MLYDDILILKERDVSSILAGRDLDIIEVVRRAYEAHAREHSSLPHSTFLHFPDASHKRIIALPAYLGREFEIAGIKWIASFPANRELGLDRASAVIILNSTETGRPLAILEGSVISAKRTAASAALAAQHLHQERAINCIGIVGCGPIGFEIVRFLQATYPEIMSFMALDIQPTRAEEFRNACSRHFMGIEVEIARDLPTLMRKCCLIALATTASRPHIADLSDCQPGSTILHVSLRDIAPEAILSCDNIADDIDHVCRGDTSVHLAEQLVGNRNFIRCSLPNILLNEAPPRIDDQSIAVFSPFGMGILDMAIAQLVYAGGLEQGLGTVIDSFLPATRREESKAAIA